MTEAQQPTPPAPRKPVSKSVRFEVFKRDSFKCQYCGASAPDILLQIDHIKPVSQGGTNDILNLLTACANCNSGKSNKALDDSSALAKRKAQLDDLQERREQLEMMTAWIEGLQDLDEQAAQSLMAYWQKLTPGFTLNERGQQNIRKWLKKFSLDEIMKAMHTAAVQYLKYQNDGKITHDSVELGMSKVPGICRVERESLTDPDIKDLYYIRGILRKKCEHYINEREALEWLRTARSWDMPIAELRSIAHQTRNWTHFVKLIDEGLEDWKQRTGQK
jgi:cytochrome c553